MGTLIFLLLAFIFLSAFFVWERSRPQVYRAAKSWDLNEPSPLSRAITGLLGVGGGIYLSLQLFISFLEIKVPSLVNLGGMDIDPVATLSLSLAIIQAFAQYFYRRFVVR
ncbi:MAG: hypothetical protein ACOYU7_02450 [Bacillota bacterium]